MQKINLSEIKNVLILRQDRLGDLIISIGFLKELKQILKNSKIDILLGNKNYFAKDLVGSNINNAYHYDKKLFSTLKLLLQLKMYRYDLIIDLFDNPSKTSEIFIKLLRPKYSIGFDQRKTKLYTHNVKLPDKSTTHIIDRIKNLLLPLTDDLNLFDIKPKLEIESKKLLSVNKPVIGINLKGSNMGKFWGLDNNVMLINQLKSQYEIVLLYSKSDTELARQVLDNTGIIDYGTHSFYDFLPLLNSIDVLISPDTATIHLVDALGKKVIGLYTCSDLKKFGMPWYPYSDSSYSIVSSNSLQSIGFANVLDKLDSIIELK